MRVRPLLIIIILFISAVSHADVEVSPPHLTSANDGQMPTSDGPVLAYQVFVEGARYGGAMRIFIRSPLGDARRRAASH